MLIKILLIFLVFIDGSHAFLGRNFKFVGPIATSKRTMSIQMAGFGAPKKVEEKVVNPLDQCACGSGSTYADCCQQFHLGKGVPPNPVKAVRARFSALVYKLLPYMIATTHPSHKEYVAPEQKSKRKQWERDLQTFAEEYELLSVTFDNEEADSNPTEDKATVNFRAKMKRNGLDRAPETMEETSTFIKTDGAWLYAGLLCHIIKVDFGLLIIYDFFTMPSKMLLKVTKFPRVCKVTARLSFFLTKSLCIVLYNRCHH
jgi:SEC-C motif-containing protein